MKIPGRVGHVARPARGCSSHRRQFQSVHTIVFAGENVAPQTGFKRLILRIRLVFFASFQKPGFVGIFHIADRQFVSSRQSQPSADDVQDDGGDCVRHYFTLWLPGAWLSYSQE